MNRAVLQSFRDMAADLANRGFQKISIELKSGTVIEAKYDPMFNTVVLASATFPASELGFWMGLCWGSVPVKIVKRL
ncbi:MAG TPA: hypothetical protein VMT62_15530 [Syntrophorhabdaceae bacterium]|nr:hypothetical protein [Syntrophorhabdaceae bacterium]